MAEVTATPDGGASITIGATETAGLKALAAQRLPLVVKARSWFSKDVAPELGPVITFLESLASSPAEGSTLTVTAPQKQALQGLLNAHVPDFQAILAVVESPAVRELLTLAESLL